MELMKANCEEHCAERDELQEQLATEKSKAEEENKTMMESLEVLEVERQELVIKYTKLQDNLSEVGASNECKAREVKALQDKIKQQEGESTEAQHKMEFLQAQLEEREAEKEGLQTEMAELKVGQAQADRRLGELVAEGDSAREKAANLEKLLEDKKAEAVQV